jgi:hypothetical protein
MCDEPYTTFFDEDLDDQNYTNFFLRGTWAVKITRTSLFEGDMCDENYMNSFSGTSLERRFAPISSRGRA